ncbi:hypothetical protein [Streptomyces alboflavus]|uniref:hypothetical protein n=1 Tax=Streptomyces alboflavus TaxID=67267 RepID=UPI0036B0CCFA
MHEVPGLRRLPPALAGAGRRDVQPPAGGGHIDDPVRVVDKGFKRYASPEAASRDKAWHRGDEGDTRRTRRERDTAVADIECKREHNTAGVWRTVAAERQRRDISRHRSAYESVRADQERVRSTVRNVLGAGG